ncbi:MAG: phenylalanine--tRNA ligase subunit beta, partial [Alphaproteobacteria bacterium]
RAAWSPSRLPSVERDFAFIVSRDVRAGDLVTAVRKASPLISDVLVFDRYEGAPLAEDEISLALRVRLTPSDHTLTDAEIEETAKAIVKAAARAVGARLRG